MKTDESWSWRAFFMGALVPLADPEKVMYWIAWERGWTKGFSRAYRWGCLVGLVMWILVFALIFCVCVLPGIY